MFVMFWHVVRHFVALVAGGELDTTRRGAVTPRSSNRARMAVDVQTGVVMVVYLHEALDKRLAAGGDITANDVLQATIDGSVLRLRPKLMTVTVVMASLVPILWSTGVGPDVMKPIAAPIIGGMITSTVHVLINIPIIFYMLKVRALRQGSLKPSESVG